MPRTVAPLKMMSLGRSSGTGSDGKPSRAAVPPLREGGKALADRFRVAAHFQQHFGALIVRQLAGLAGPVVVAGVERDIGAELLGQFQPPRGSTSVTRILPAPAARAIVTAIRPMMPTPVISTLVR